MAYATGGLIEATDFNNLKNLVNQVYGVGFGNSGYGQSAISLPTVVGGNVELVKSLEWTNLLNATQVCANHQGSVISLPPSGQLAVGALIRAHTAANNTGDFPTSIATIGTNKLVAASGSMTNFANQLVSTRTTAWTTQIRHTFTATFSTVEEARYFFNSGGEIRLRASRTGGSASSQNTAWTNLLSSMGTLKFNHTTLLASVGTSTNVGYYDLPLSFTSLYSLSDTAVGYTANNVLVEGQTIDGPGGANGDNGRQISLRITFNDSHTGGSDSVDGTFTSAIDIYRATTHLTTVAPVLSTTVALTAGT